MISSKKEELTKGSKVELTRELSITKLYGVIKMLLRATNPISKDRMRLTYNRTTNRSSLLMRKFLQRSRSLMCRCIQTMKLMTLPMFPRKKTKRKNLLKR